MTQRQRIIILADCQSFYASVEKSLHPEYADRPLIVAGDPTRRSGIVLAACPIAKSYGITTAERLGEALAKCPDVIVMQPRMQTYIDRSLEITEIYEQYTDLVEPYSIDEQFLDVTGSTVLFGDSMKIAQQLQDQVMEQTGIFIRLGISYSKVTAKMACDCFAKKSPSGIFMLQKDDLPDTLWRQPVQSMFMIGSRMTRHLYAMGVRTIGDLARMPLASLRRRWGINGEVIWRIANGIDDSPVTPNTHDRQQVIGHQMTLPRDYYTKKEIEVILLELSELVCRRCRAKGYMGGVVAVGCQGADFERPSGFYRQMKLPDPTYISKHVYEAAKHLFAQHWDGRPVRKLGVTLSGLVPDDEYQLCIFDEREKYAALERAVDEIKSKYGEVAIMRAVSLTGAGQARDRSSKIGGHFK